MLAPLSRVKRARVYIDNVDNMVEYVSVITSEREWPSVTPQQQSRRHAMLSLRTSAQHTALHYAAWEGHAEIVTICATPRHYLRPPVSCLDS